VPKFTDTITIRVKAGHGGRGSVSFHREKFIPKGGPDGGDGGRGGNVYVQADSALYNLSHLFKDRTYKAGNGGPGSGNNKHGGAGADLVVRVPPGTQVLEEETGRMIADLTADASRCMVVEGGIGGRGNTFFKSPTNQTPRFSQPGTPGQEKRIVLSLKLIADIGLVGLPNAGKSTILSRITNARPKIADYPFTTLVPNLGVVRLGDGSAYRIADIPGIIEGAHRGLGLGLSFLRHIERVRAVLFVLDATLDDLDYNMELLRSELDSYGGGLTSKPYYIIVNKTDLIDKSALAEKIKKLHDARILTISALTGENMERLPAILESLMETGRAEKKPHQTR
jgi:GTP-binding protein